MSESQHQELDIRHIFHWYLPLLYSCLQRKGMCLPLRNECPSGTSSKKQRWGIAASHALPALLGFLCRKTKTRYYNTSKHFVNRNFLTICWSRESCQLTYSCSRVLPAAISWNKAIEQHKRNEKFGVFERVGGHWCGGRGTPHAEIHQGSSSSFY